MLLLLLPLPNKTLNQYATRNTLYYFQMKVTGFSFICNAVKNDYPIAEAIKSILPICDEFVVAVGDCQDKTLALIESINSPKIKIIHTVWDNSIREGGRTFALETDKAFAAISAYTDWAFYIQGDECVHQKYLHVIKKAMEENLDDQHVEGLLLKYLHFYGSYEYYGDSRRWYRREIRIIRNNRAIHSYRDAQGFRISDRKLNVKLIDAYVYHYGWVKPPSGLVRKGMNFNLFYHKDAVETTIPETAQFDYGNADNMKLFTGTHPKVMLPRIKAVNWEYTFDPTKVKSSDSLRRRLLQKFYEWTGIRVGEYRNYRII